MLQITEKDPTTSKDSIKIATSQVAGEEDDSDQIGAKLDEHSQTKDTRNHREMNSQSKNSESGCLPDNHPEKSSLNITNNEAQASNFQQFQ